MVGRTRVNMQKVYIRGATGNNNILTWINECWIRYSEFIPNCIICGLIAVKVNKSKNEPMTPRCRLTYTSV